MSLRMYELEPPAAIAWSRMSIHLPAYIQYKHPLWLGTSNCGWQQTGSDNEKTEEQDLI